jgi:hypothetical protein
MTIRNNDFMVGSSSRTKAYGLSLPVRDGAVKLRCGMAGSVPLTCVRAA